MAKKSDIETKSSIVLQRAFRRWRSNWNETLNVLVWGIMQTREKAAIILQRWWRRYLSINSLYNSQKSI
ncbi:uncharacterized protein cubi_01430 [Cryptosporidium ubiquitum]|uniref:Uncharacterized protein n=1 Tax=Cryptosporidium ubiquitum TaxID=857276 RepID=A0A1J4MCZ4_9CRYT|nr:uncharacterized protein cubi_01430 [Cryptosporidium ubiquitum]OII72097.1 hypothetical protein cubi_01430 [Cryptosporidium ubiquitum]